MAYSVMIDAGHGAGSNHNRGYRGKLKNEGDANWHFAQQLRKWCLEYGFKVGQTRPKITDRPAVSGQDLSNDLYQRMLAGAGYTFYISCHTNAFRVNQATGTEVWIANSRSSGIAKRITDSVSSLLNITNRGVKYGQYAVLNGNRASYSMLAEFCFHDNDRDVKRYEDNLSLTAYTVATQMARYIGITKIVNFGTTPNKPVTPSKPTKDMEDIMNRGSQFLVCYTENSDRELIKGTVDYFMQGKGANVTFSRSGIFDYTGLNNIGIVCIGGSKVKSKGVFTGYGTKYYVENAQDLKTLASGQANWQPLKTFNGR